MSGLSELLRPDSILLQQNLESKRRVLEVLSATLAQNLDTSKRALLDLLLARERLGSTAVGDGCAIPHCRIPGETRSSAAILTLREGIDFDADDGDIVDIFLALAVPAEATEEHLQHLKEVASLLDNPEKVQCLRDSQQPQILLQTLAEGTFPCTSS